MPYYQHAGQQFHYLDAGQGQPVVLLHGLGSCGADWPEQVATLQQHYRVIAPDLRGHGHSEASPGPYTMAMLAEDVFALLQQLKLQDIHLVGFSLGGMVAFEMVTQQLSPSSPYNDIQFRSLTVINSGPHMLLDRWQIKFTYAFRIAAIRLLGLPRLGKMISKKLFPEPQQAPLRTLFSERMANMSCDAYRATLTAITRWSVLDALPAITLPTLVISADQDYSPVTEKHRYAEKMPNAQVVVVTDSRHATPMDQPEKLNRLLATFFHECQPVELAPTD